MPFRSLNFHSDQSQLKAEATQRHTQGKLNGSFSEEDIAPGAYNRINAR